MSRETFKPWSMVLRGAPAFCIAPANTATEALALAASGEYRFAHCQGGTVKLVPKDYELKMFESWAVMETTTP